MWTCVQVLLDPMELLTEFVALQQESTTAVTVMVEMI